MLTHPKGYTTPPKFGTEWGVVWKKRLLAFKSSNISETSQDKTKVTVEVQYNVTYELLIGGKINDLR